MTNDELPLAIYYAELGSPTKGRGAVGLAVAQARAEERARIIEGLEKYKYSISLNNVTFRIPKAEWEALKSGQMPAAATKIGFERIKGMPPFYGRGKDSLRGEVD